MATVLFVCLRNAGRSQMSRALFDRAAAGRHRGLSAGSIADPAGEIPGKRYLDWGLPDPAGRPLDEVRAIRDDIAVRVRDLVRQLDQTDQGAS